MTREERDNAITILENEKKCVNRANKNDYCNRDCYNCELVKTDTEILTALDMAIQALEQSMPTMVYPQVDGITPTVVAQADGEKTCGTCRNEDTYHCAECENKSDYEQSQADGEYISRQAVMDCYKKWQPYMATKLHEFEKELSELPSVAIPSAEPKTEWIPVSERLPEDKQSVLVWCSQYKNIYCAYLEKKQWWIFGAFIQIVPNEVVAWMPLPKPYEPQESEDKECTKKI